MNDKALRNILFLDIETASAEASYADLSERMQKLWDKKASYLKNDDHLPSNEFYYKRAGIYAEFGKIICIGFGGMFYDENNVPHFRVKTISGHDEAELLLNFKNILEKHKAGIQLALCSHNGKEFDFPYICRRMLVHGIELPSTLKIAGKKPWEIPHIDTLDFWKFGDFKHYTSLDLLSAVFDIPSSKVEMSGEDVNKIYYEENDLARIERYCKEDVVVLAQLYLKMQGMDTIAEENIERVSS